MSDESMAATLRMVAYHALYLFLVSRGYPAPPEDDYEELHLGEHVVWMAGTHVPDQNIDSAALWDALSQYCAEQNKVIAPILRYNAYGVNCFPCDHCGGTHLYVAIYQ